MWEELKMISMIILISLFNNAAFNPVLLNQLCIKKVSMKTSLKYNDLVNSSRNFETWV